MPTAEKPVRIVLPEDVLAALMDESEREGIPVTMCARRALVRTYRTVSGDDRNPDKTTGN
jgi:hypothetical protein